MSAVTVVDPGVHTTVQDLGRRGFAHLGVPPAGALDPLSAALANRLVGNPDDAAVLECVLRGPVLQLDSSRAVALVGAPSVGLPAQRVSVVSDLRVGALRGGLRSWVAVAGGIATEVVLGSRSCDTLTGLGGGPLHAGAVLALGVPRADAPDVGPVEWPPLPRDGVVTVRVAPGPEHAAVSVPLDGWTVDPRSDRTGLRLAGAPALGAADARVESFGLVAGAVQVPPDGQPVVLLANHQVTGGYPVPLVVIAADVGLLAQARPGQRVRFTPVDVSTARDAWRLRVTEVLGGGRDRV